jgi:hypothetical protein
VTFDKKEGYDKTSRLMSCKSVETISDVTSSAVADYCWFILAIKTEAAVLYICSLHRLLYCLKKPRDTRHNWCHSSKKRLRDASL